MSFPMPEDSQVWIANRYQVSAALGMGGLGVVYSGWDHELNRPVAIKRIKSREDATPDDLVEEAFNEARALALLRHPHVVKLYDFGMDEEGPYFIMELIEGETLQERIDRSVLTVEEFRQIAHMTLEGLAAAHRQGIVHLDIKPSNLMLVKNADGRLLVKILDFGLSRLHQQKRRGQTSGTSIYGTYHYVAPEQILLQEVGPRTDLYSLGHVLYHALTQVPAFDAPTIEEVLQMHLHGRPENIGEIRPDLDGMLGAWLHRLMERDPELRPASAAEAMRELARAHLGTNQTPQTPEPPAEAPQVEPRSVISRLAKRTTASIRKLIDATFGASER
jgi:serine/threonine-protein kinase